MIINPGMTRRDLPWVDARQFGVAGDGVTDDTAAIQAALNAINPYPYVPGFSNGQLTTSEFGGVLRFKRGRYKITSTILVPPNVEIIGEGGLLSNSAVSSTTTAGTVFVAGANIAGFMFDNAPWDNTGARVQSRIATAAQIDGSLVQAAGAIRFSSLRIEDGGFNLFGGVNLACSPHSEVFQCGIIGAAVGVQASISWMSNVKENFIRPRNIGIALFQITEGNASENRIGHLPTGYPSFSYTPYPFSQDATYAGYKRSIYLSETNLEVRRNCIDSVNCQVGIMFRYNLGNRFADNYMEGVTNACYASELGGGYIEPGYTACPSADLWHGHVYALPMQPVVLDWSKKSAYAPTTSADRLRVAKIASPASAGSANNIVLKPSSQYIPGTLDATLIGKIESVQSVATPTATQDGHNTSVSDIFVSSTGSDSNYGLSPISPVLSLAGAINVAKLLGKKNVQIKVQFGESIYTGASSTATTIISILSAMYLSIVGADFKATGSSTPPVITVSTDGANCAYILNNSSDGPVAIYSQNVDWTQPSATNGWIFGLNQPTEFNFVGGTITLANNMILSNRKNAHRVVIYNTSVTAGSTVYLFATAGAASVNIAVVSGSGTISANLKRGAGTWLASDVPA